MPINIINRTSRPVLVRLNSGDTLHLGPEATASGLKGVELTGNVRINRLKEKGIISIEPIPAKAPPPKPKK